MNVVNNVLNINLIRIRYVRIPYADKSIVFWKIKLSRKKIKLDKSWSSAYITKEI